jgi:prevent-host-death family protein
MSSVYSLFEAKAKLSEIIRRVRTGERAAISLRGRIVAEIVPAEPPDSSLEARLATLEADGCVAGGTSRKAELKPLARRPGGLKRFLRARE